MSLFKFIPKITVFMQKRPLLFNTVIYGSFYTAAEFTRQSYGRMFMTAQTAPTTTEMLIDTNNVGTNKYTLLTWVETFNETLGLTDKQPIDVTDYNWPQLKRYAIYGCFLAGPLLYGWYKWLDNFYRGKSIRIVLTKLTLDQFVLTPVLVILFFTSMSLMEGKSDIFMECRMKFLKTFQTSCIYWLPVQFVNFMVIPPNLRVSYVSIAAFCWVNILCYLKSTPLPKYEESSDSVE